MKKFKAWAVIDRETNLIVGELSTRLPMQINAEKNRADEYRDSLYCDAFVEEVTIVRGKVKSKKKPRTPVVNGFEDISDLHSATIRAIEDRKRRGKR